MAIRTQVERTKQYNKVFIRFDMVLLSVRMRYYTSNYHSFAVFMFMENYRKTVTTTETLNNRKVGVNYVIYDDIKIT